jgi:hypothetical protein
MSKLKPNEYYEAYSDKLKKLLDSVQGMDRFSVIFTLMKILMQRVDPELDSSWLINSHDENGNPIKIDIRNERLKGTSVALMHEVLEFHRELDWKWWKTTKPEDQWWNNNEKNQHLLDELVDQLHFVFQNAILLGYDETDLFMAFAVKHLENMARQEEGY